MMFGVVLTVFSILMVLPLCSSKCFTSHTPVSCSLTCHCRWNRQCDSNGRCESSGCDIDTISWAPWGGPSCQRGNVGYYKPAIKSGDDGPAASYAVDGLRNNRDSLLHCSKSSTHPGGYSFWEVDLGTDHLVEEVIITTSSHFGESVNSIKARIGSDYLEDCLGDNGSTRSRLTFHCNAATRIGSRVRIEKRYATQNMYLCEVYVKGYQYVDCINSGNNYYYGPGCSTNCHCSEQCHMITGVCGGTCFPGYTGDTCGTRCSAGRWGRNCANYCYCQDSCNNINGRCSGTCIAGRFGERCEYECSSGTWGAGNRYGCPNQCHCRQECDKGNGHCDAGCQPGYQGSTCQRRCDSGHWGTNCANNCNCRDSCHHITGACPSACVSGMFGRRCDQHCTSGTWGEGDIDGCPNQCHCQEPCNKVNGQCSGECSAGYKGSTCQQTCDNGKWGLGCGHQCHCQQPCNKVNGQCLGGCSAGYKGSTCQQTCDVGTWGLGCRHQCHCQETCDTETGQCDADCQPGYQGPSCQMMCDLGRWGPGCNQQCQCMNSNETCNMSTGECTDDCPLWHTGNDCAVSLPRLGESDAPEMINDGKNVTFLFSVWDPDFTSNVDVSYYIVEYMAINASRWNRFTTMATVYDITILFPRAMVTYQYRVVPVRNVSGIDMEGEPSRVTMTTLECPVGYWGVDCGPCNCTMEQQICSQETGVCSANCTARFIEDDCYFHEHACVDVLGNSTLVVSVVNNELFRITFDGLLNSSADNVTYRAQYRLFGSAIWQISNDIVNGELQTFHLQQNSIYEFRILQVHDKVIFCPHTKVVNVSTGCDFMIDGGNCSEWCDCGATLCQRSEGFCNSVCSSTAACQHPLPSGPLPSRHSLRWAFKSNITNIEITVTISPFNSLINQTKMTVRCFGHNYDSSINISGQGGSYLFSGLQSDTRYMFTITLNTGIVNGSLVAMSYNATHRTLALQSNRVDIVTTESADHGTESDVEPIAVPSKSRSEESSNGAAVIGPVIGGVLLIVIAMVTVGVIVMYVLMKVRKQNEESDSSAAGATAGATAGGVDMKHNSIFDIELTHSNIDGNNEVSYMYMSNSNLTVCPGTRSTPEDDEYASVGGAPVHDCSQHDGYVEPMPPCAAASRSEPDDIRAPGADGCATDCATECATACASAEKNFKRYDSDRYVTPKSYSVVSKKKSEDSKSEAEKSTSELENGYTVEDENPYTNTLTYDNLNREQ